MNISTDIVNIKLFRFPVNGANAGIIRAVQNL